MGKPLPEAQQRIVDGLIRGERIVFRLGRYDAAPAWWHGAEKVGVPVAALIKKGIVRKIEEEEPRRMNDGSIRGTKPVILLRLVE